MKTPSYVISMFENKKSNILRHEEIDYFEILEQNIAKYRNLGKLFVTGDFNSRTGQSSEITDYLNFDSYLNVGMTDNHDNNDIPLRTSKDSVTDNYGRRLLDLCKSTGLIIANGRLGADKYIGDFTCITPRGQSVVDYILLAFSDFGCVSHFSICDADEH